MVSDESVMTIDDLWYGPYDKEHMISVENSPGFHKY